MGKDNVASEQALVNGAASVSAVPASIPDADALAIKPFIVEVYGFGEYTYYARSRSKALSEAWQASLVCNTWSFKDFLKDAKAYSGVGHEQFGERVEVCGKPAFLVKEDSQYLHFVRPDSEEVFTAHPLDVEPPEARRFTSYAQAIEARSGETERLDPKDESAAPKECAQPQPRGNHE